MVHFGYGYRMKLTILGSGTSHGVPVIGCTCPVCNSPDSKDKRMRCSLYIEGSAGERALIDAGPEFRLQALRAGISALDAIFLTHAHADHVHGLDDIRPLSREKSIPVYGNEGTIAEFRERFSYIFRETQQGGGKPHIELVVISKPLQLGGLYFFPIPLKHGNLDVLGWKITEKTKNLMPGKSNKTISAVYLTDCTYISDDSFAMIIEGGPPDLAIIDGLRSRPHKTHFNFEQAIHAAIRIGAKQLYLTHICHDYLNKEIEDYCRTFAGKLGCTIPMGPAWDGLVVEL